MECVTQEFNVIGMTCDHCARSVGKEIRKIDGVDSVDVDLVSGLVTVTSLTELDPSRVATAVDEAGYDLVRR